MASSSHLQILTRIVVRHRILLSAGLSVAAGIVLKAHLPIQVGDPLVSYAALVRPGLYQLLTSSYAVFLFTTPYLMLSMLLSFIYVHFYREQVERVAGALPLYPAPASRGDLFLVLGEVHEHPNRRLLRMRWLSIPEHGLYTGIAALGAIGSGKTQGLILPAMRQLFGYRAHDLEKKLSGVVLEVKGDLCRQLKKILKECGRESDYIEVGLHSDIRYNPLNNDLDPYAQAFNIASIITSIWGRGKEPFWQQSYTDLVRYVILLHRVRDGYLTLVDIFRTVISAGRLEQLLAEIGSRLSMTAYVAISEDDYTACRDSACSFWFCNQRHLRSLRSRMVPATGRSPGNERASIVATIYAARGATLVRQLQFDSVCYWYWEHWKFFRNEVKTSIVQGIAVFLSLFEADPDVRRVFCPPKELYEGKASVRSYWQGLAAIR